jgi:hypothetical protein
LHFSATFCLFVKLLLLQSHILTKVNTYFCSAWDSLPFYVFLSCFAIVSWRIIWVLSRHPTYYTLKTCNVFTVSFLFWKCRIIENFKSFQNIRSLVHKSYFYDYNKSKIKRKEMRKVSFFQKWCVDHVKHLCNARIIWQ